MNEKEKLKLINDDMYCGKYDMFCGDVPYEVIDEEVMDLTGLGFSAYECELNCKTCNEMIELM